MVQKKEEIHKLKNWLGQRHLSGYCLTIKVSFSCLLKILKILIQNCVRIYGIKNRNPINTHTILNQKFGVN